MAGLHSNYPRPDWMDNDSEVVKGLPAAVVLLRDHGRRVTKSQIDAANALVGRLVIAPVDPTLTKRGVRSMAQLQRPGQNELGNVRPPLFNPVVEKLDAHGMVLSGYEIECIDGVPVQYVQAWLVRPLAGGDR
jgi:hypothetical protein